METPSSNYLKEKRTRPQIKGKTLQGAFFVRFLGRLAAFQIFGMALSLINFTILRNSALIIGSANLAGFALSAGLHTHALTDLVGVGSFVLTTLQLTALQKSGQLTSLPIWDNRLLLVNSLIGVWGVRLAGYLFHRISYIKEDKRLEKFYPAPGEGYFDKNRSNFPIGLATFWSIQALWGFITMLPVTLLNSASASLATSSTGAASSSGLLSVLSLSHSANQLFNLLPPTLYSSSNIIENICRFSCRTLVALPIVTLAAGVCIEGLADYQKYLYKSDPKNENHWCDVGLWQYSRFPNYFGEMTVWWSAFAAAIPSTVVLYASKNISRLSAVSLLALSALSPVFITSLLMNLSGVPIHDRNNFKRFGNDPNYQKYVSDTPTIIPNFFKLFQRKISNDKKDL